MNVELRPLRQQDFALAAICNYWDAPRAVYA